MSDVNVVSESANDGDSSFGDRRAVGAMEVPWPFAPPRHDADPSLVELARQLEYSWRSIRQELAGIKSVANQTHAEAKKTNGRVRGLESAYARLDTEVSGLLRGEDRRVADRRVNTVTETKKRVALLTVGGVVFTALVNLITHLDTVVSVVSHLWTALVAASG